MRNIHELKLELMVRRMSQLDTAMSISIGPTLLNLYLNGTRPMPDKVRKQLERAIAKHDAQQEAAEIAA